MNKLFYPKLAWSNLKRNGSTYFPYLLTCICTIATFYTLFSITVNSGIQQIKGGDTVAVMLNLGTIIIGIFSVVLIFYTNGFLIKRRKKELGLYNILGMEKRHIAKVMLFEMLFTALISLVIGLLFSLLVSKLLFFALLHILKVATPMHFEISVMGIWITVGLFLTIFGVTLLFNFVQIQLTNPINLLRGGQQGEKEPKSSWLLTLIGVLSLAAGYYIALVTESPTEALAWFFLAVLLVIIGTYCLFTSGSIALLKLLKRNHRFFYHPNHFIAVSGMIYRMKQNAVGLANICILSTMVLVTISSTVCLYLGQEDMFKTQYPSEVQITTSNEQEDISLIQDVITQQLETYHLQDVNRDEYSFVNTVAVLNKNQLDFRPKVVDTVATDCFVLFYPLEDFNRLQQTDYQLEQNQALIFSYQDPYDFSDIDIEGKTYQIKEQLQQLTTEKKQRNLIRDFYILVLKDINELERLQSLINSFRGTIDTVQYQIQFDLQGDESQFVDFTHSLSESIFMQNDQVSHSIRSRSENKQQWMTLYGGFFFLGLFLGFLFMMATVLIIYYKQISEGYDDHDRFEIMKKVGMSKKEVKKTIHKQIVMIFFLPLLVAIIHIVVAFKVICRLLLLFGMIQTELFLICTIITVLVFAVIYAVVYLLTAKTYYKLVQ